MVPRADPARAREAAAAIVRTLRDHGHTAYFAGGCVRDELLGLEPTDYDIATDATPDRLKSLFPRSGEVGASFGVVLVKQRGIAIEVATFRSDGPYTDRRRPDVVHFSTPALDAARRDFTINALFLDPLAPPSPQAPDARGLVIDFVGGLNDMKSRILRAVGNPAQRLAEDHLRALRGARFAARLGLTIDPLTASAIRDHAAELGGVSRERIGEEVKRMLTHPTRARALELLRELNLEGPVLDDGAKPTSPPTTLAGLSGDTEYATALAAWALDRDQTWTVAASWRRSLCLSNEDCQAMEAVLKAVALIEDGWLGLPVAARKRSAAAPAFAQALRLVQARQPATAASVHKEVERLSQTGLAPDPLVTGEHLIAMGLKPGPIFRRVLDGVYDAQLEGRVADQESAQRLAAALAEQG
jgi:poly(A) polymerase